MSREPVMVERPDSLPTETHRVKTGCGNLYVTYSTDPKCFELDLRLGKSGGCCQAMLEVIRGLITIARRQLNPIPRKLIIHQLQGIRCPQDSPHIPSCPQAVCQILAKFWGEEEG